MKKLILDYSKWRCGTHEEELDQENKLKHCLGYGKTKLLNEAGYMCCLGQFSLQLKPNLKKEQLLNLEIPSDLKVNVKNLNLKGINGYFCNSDLSRKAISINDNVKTTVEEKITALKELFLTHGYEIEVINKPY